jgi:hypothetical protein
MQVYTYKGYKIVVRDNGKVTVAVEHSTRQRHLHTATSLDLAMKWVDAYRAGHHWAVDRPDGWDDTL